MEKAAVKNQDGRGSAAACRAPESQVMIRPRRQNHQWQNASGLAKAGRGIFRSIAVASSG
jgi:hypothetical protein